MALTGAEKQRRYRERHLGKDGTKVRLQAFVSLETEGRLYRLAWHYGCNLTGTIEKIIADADKAVLDALPEEDVAAYLTPEKVTA